MNHTLITALGFLIIFLATTLGSAIVFLIKKDMSERVHTAILSFAIGIMIAAAVFSLLVPAIDTAESWGRWSFVPAAVGFVLGGFFLVVLDKVIPHNHVGTDISEGPVKSMSKALKMFFAVTMHNIPEGLTVGIAFGAAATLGTDAAFLSALGLAIGISLQNLPEGAAVAMPVKLTTGSRAKGFLFGIGSGAVEPIAALAGYFIASAFTAIQPWFLGFAAGAMIFVIVEDLIPDAKLEKHPHIGTWGIMIGFVIMMVLDVALG